VKRILAISDIHGEYDKLIKLLDKVEYNNKEDQLIIIGDYADRGQKSKEVVEKCIELQKLGAITLVGNHDRMFTSWITTDSIHNEQMFVQNGGVQTIESYMGRDWIQDGLTYENYQIAKEFIKNNYSHHIEFLRQNDIYHELDNYVFVHAGVKPYLLDWKRSTENDYLWIRDEFILNPHEYEETFVFGHTPAQFMNEDHSNNIWFGYKKIGIDGGACFKGGQLNCLEIKNGTYRQFSVQ